MFETLWRPVRESFRERFLLLGFVAKWTAITIPLGLIVGSLVAFFLWSLDRATELRWEHPWLLYLLPLGGFVIGLVYQLIGKSADAGNNLIIEEIHRAPERKEAGGGVPLRMTPLVLAGTLLTHLLGGSAGREGTAVQMGGSVASTLGQWCRMGPIDRQIVLMAGIAAGFGAVFGTPLAGAIFALEVVALGRLTYQALIPCLLASIVGDYVTTAWGVGHIHYHIQALPHAATMPTPHISVELVAIVAIAGIAFGLTAALFSELAHALQRFFKTWIRWAQLRPVVGGLAVVGLVYLVGTRDYLGLGVTADPSQADAVTIQSCFQPGGARWFSWWWKILFTAITVGSGFRGGEVTPLFFIGAALGHVLGVLLGVPVDFMAGLGFVAVFAGATNTPLACTIMGIELFAPGNGELLNSGFVLYLAIACFLSYLMSGHTGIYLSQLIATPKARISSPTNEVSLRSLRDKEGGSGSESG